ncbi:hypothetical protein V1477_004750 [Vespula maculifrons]|uniref:Uncharacterized protein n=1 Tax=Vespula maculifrons TaxID=7453 RepID=A0ABD2CNS0_VESMC
MENIGEGLCSTTYFVEIKNDDLLVDRKIRINENLDQKAPIHSIGQSRATTFNFKDILTSSSNSEYLISEFPQTLLVDSA